MRHENVKLEFKKIEPDETFQELVKILDGLVLVKSGQYLIESDISPNREFFENEENYRMFFDTFAEFVHPIWKSDWDFRKFPFRKPSDEIDGLVSILRSGGAYSKKRSFEEAIALENDFKKRFRGQSSDLLVFCVVDYVYSNQETKSYAVNIKTLSELEKISRWFFQIAWDNLICIVNPDTKNLYVVAFTDED
ncbi:MAG: hypothetical protein P1Q69_14090 [Candidatus Thorarchaeota archaeon]|nr:hypothetical protein [Candidatus Thorarchaeota archaeon]